MNDPFDQLLLKAIDKTLRSTFGHTAMQIIYNHLESKSCPKSEIPRKLDVFCSELRNILGIQASKQEGVPSNITVIGTITVLEKVITRELSKKLGVQFNERGPIQFSSHIAHLKRVYYSREDDSIPVSTEHIIQSRNKDRDRK